MDHTTQWSSCHGVIPSLHTLAQGVAKYYVELMTNMASNMVLVVEEMTTGDPYK